VNQDSNNNSIIVNIPTSVILKVILVFVGAFLVYTLMDVLIIILFAIIIASALTPFVNWLDKKGLPRLLGLTALYLGFFGLIILFLSLIIPVVSFEINQLIKDLPDFIKNISSSIEQAQGATTSRYFDFFNELLNILDTFSQYLSTSSQSIISFVVNLFGGLISFAAIIVISFYLAYMKNGVQNFIKTVLPFKYEANVLKVWERSEKKIGKWVQGQLLLALVVGLAVYIGLSLLGVKFALLLGIFAMVLELVPNVGPVLASIPAIILGFAQGSAIGIWVVVLYIVVQQIENHVLVPLVLGRSLGLNPVLVIIALLVGAKLGGIPGVILAVPTAAIILEIFEEIAQQTGYKRKGQEQII